MIKIFVYFDVNDDDDDNEFLFLLKFCDKEFDRCSLQINFEIYRLVNFADNQENYLVNRSIKGLIIQILISNWSG